MGTEVQVVYPTLFLMYLTNDVSLEIALCRAYNNWMSEVYRKGKGRLRWVTVLPLRSIDESLLEMKRAKEHGAVGLFFRGIEKDLTLDHPYFFPIYDQAAKLDLPVCIHTGSGAPAITALFDLERNGQWAHSGLLPLNAFSDLVRNRIPDRFPGLKFGFIEATAGWAPYLVHRLKKTLRRRWKYSSDADLFQDYRFFVACEADEDIPYLMQ